MCNLIEYNDNYSKISGTLWQYCRDEPAADANSAIGDFNAANATTRSFNIKTEINRLKRHWCHRKCSHNGTIKICKNFWRNYKMFLTDCEINLDLDWSESFIIAATGIGSQGAHSQ